MQNLQIPQYVSKYFWGDNLSELSLDRHENYIAQTLLDKGDLDALSWLFSQVDRDSIKDRLSKFKLTPQSAHFWSVYLS